MEKNQAWANRVVGETDELHFAYRFRSAHAGAATRPKGRSSTPSIFTRHYAGISASNIRRVQNDFRSIILRITRFSG